MQIETTEYNEETVEAGLQIRVLEQGAYVDKIAVPSGIVTISVLGDTVVYSDVMRELNAKMQRITEGIAPSGTDYSWVLYMSYTGRCWYMECDSTKPDDYEIGYLEFKNIEGLVTLFQGSN